MTAGRAALGGLGLLPRLAYAGIGTPLGTVSSVDPAGALNHPPGQGKGQGTT